MYFRTLGFRLGVKRKSIFILPLQIRLKQGRGLVNWALDLAVLVPLTNRNRF
jgi:hypothetical protein